MISTSAISDSSDRSLNKPAKLVVDYRIGGLDKRGRRVLDILWATKDFVIFQHAKGISPHFSDDDEESREQAKRYMNLGPYLSRINALLPSFTEDNQSSDQYNWSFFHTPNAFLYRETARAIANALSGNHDLAIDILAFVEARLIARRRTQGQFLYLLTCTVILAIVMLIVFAHEYWIALSIDFWPYRELVRVAACGTIGGFISVAIGIRKLDVDPDTRWWVNAFYGFIRLTIAFLSAVVLYFLIKGKLIFEPLFTETSDQAVFTLYAFAVAAGFSETFIPNILRKTEENS